MEVADGDGMVQIRDSLGKGLLALGSSSLDPLASHDIVECEGDSAHIVARLDDTGHGRVVVGLGVHT